MSESDTMSQEDSDINLKSLVQLMEAQSRQMTALQKGTQSLHQINANWAEEIRKLSKASAVMAITEDKATDDPPGQEFQSHPRHSDEDGGLENHTSAVTANTRNEISHNKIRV